MRHRMRARLTLSCVLATVALAAAWSASAATVSSPLRSIVSPHDAAALAAPGQEGLRFDAAGLAALRAATSRQVEIDEFPTAPGVRGRLLLRRFEVAAANARLTLSGSGGERTLPLPSIVHFSGVIDGEPDSRVYVAAQKGALVAYVQSSAGYTYAGPDESGSHYVVRSAESPLNASAISGAFSCRAESLPGALSTAVSGPSFPAAELPEAAGFKQASVRIETDNQLYVKFGNDPDAVAAYALTLFGAVNVVYERDLAMHLTIANVHVWTSADPYTGGDTLTQLLQLGDWWHANRPSGSYPRTYVHYLSGHPVSGGIAWIGVLCSGDFAYGTDWGGGYGLTQVYGSYPLQLWDQYASAHEMGHNSGSEHTHCYSPPIDHCYNGEAGCYAGPVENPGIGNGTIMSYCHLLGWQYVSFVFHSRCINEQMLPEINTAPCLVSIPTFPDVPTSHTFFHWIETLYRVGVSAGCGNGNYCPDASVTRAEMAIFLLKSKFGASYVPPPATGTVFGDVHVGDFAADWIEELASQGITAGCGDGSNYCPTGTVTRDQMAVFLLKSLKGSSHVPPAASSVFSDVSNGNPFEPWIMELYNMGITGGCGTSPLRYCPSDPNTRGQMAVFLVKTFNLSW
ncbi:MAG TPA: M12 family metallo-peptidase [Thermoanaerobaculia bacterium]